MTDFFRRRVRPPFAYAAIVALVAACVVALQRWVPDAAVAIPLRRTALVLFAVAAALAAWLAHVRYRRVAAQAHAERLAAVVATDARRRRVVMDVMARSMVGGSTHAVCRDVADAVASALGCEHGVVLESSMDGRTFTIAAASGWDPGTLEGLTIDAGLDTQAGYALYAREPVAVADADGEPRFAIPPVLRARGVRSGIAARIATAVRPFGVLVAFSTSTRSFDDHDGEFVSANAAALAGLYERKRLEAERAELAARDTEQRAAADAAARRAGFLAQTSAVLDTALEPESTLVSLARLAVPALADCAIVDLVLDDGSVRRIDVVDIDPTRRDAVNAIKRVVPNLRGEGPFARAIRTGQPVLLADVVQSDGQSNGQSLNDTEQQALSRWVHCPSLLLIPLVARGQTLGLLTLGGRTANQYGAADLSLARELAARAAVALDNARLYREAQAASRAKDEFLATVSHELRTPINAVLGWATMLRNQQLDPARVDYACEAIERSAQAQAHLLEQLLDVSRIVSGKFELRLAPVHVDGIIEAAIDTVRPAADDKKIRIGSRIDRGIPLLMADPERLQQVMINLLSNAVKFSSEGGLVQVELARADETAQIVVHDQGAGIGPEFLPYVFDRLRQGDGPAVGGNRGLGLGLWIVRDIVERHGGTVAVASPGEGQGSTFTVTLPLRSVAEPARVAARTVAARREP